MRPALTAKLLSRGKIHERCCQGLIASVDSHRHTVVARDRSDDALLDGGAGQIGTLPPRQRSPRGGRQLTRERLDCHDHLWGESRGPSDPRQIVQSGKTLLVEPFAPLGHHLTWGVEAGSDLVVAEPLGCHQHDLGPYDLCIR
jgi:hypothetical protein